MKAHEVIIAWTPEWVYEDSYSGPLRGKLEVAKRDSPKAQLLADQHFMIEFFTPNSTPEQRMFHVFLEFQSVVVRDGIDAKLAHSQFLKIDEYAEHIAPDCQGARGVLDVLGGL